MKKIAFLSIFAALLLVACQTKKETYNFAGKILSLTELSGVEYNPESTQRPVTLIFGETENALSGNVGCNLVRGTYYANEDTLKFPQPMAMTRMLCDSLSNEVEMQMVNLLSNADKYTVSENEGVKTITIFAGEEKLGVFTVTEKESCCGEKCCDKEQCAEKKECCQKDSCNKECCQKAGEGCCKKDSCCAKEECCKGAVEEK